MLAPDDQRYHVHEDEDGKQNRGGFDGCHDEGEKGKTDQRQSVAHSAFGKPDKNDSRDCGVVK